MFPINSRKLHLWLSLIFALPMVFIITTGVLLQVKDLVPWIQPEVKKAQKLSEASSKKLSMEEILEISRSVEGAGIETWADIAQVDWRPNKALIRVRALNRNEIQIDAGTGEVLNSGKRWTSLIIGLHEGSWFSKPVKYGIFLPTAIALMALWITGMIMGFKVLAAKAKAKAKARKKQT